MKNKLQSLVYILAATLFMSCGQQSQTSQSSDAGVEYSKGQSTVSDDLSAQNVLQIAIGSKDHSTLVAAVHAA